MMIQLSILSRSI